MAKETEYILEVDASVIKLSGEWFDPFDVVFDTAAHLISAARAMRRKHAASYRQFFVGAASLSYNPETHKMRSYVGANWKPEKQARKRCAETKALGNANKNGFSYTAGMFVVGTTDRLLIQEVTGHPTPTLHPCDECRPLLNESTIVASVGSDEDVFEVYTGKKLIEFYGKPDEDQFFKRDAIEDPGFPVFALAKTIYHDITQDLREIPEERTRMVRAERAVDAIYTAANQ